VIVPSGKTYYINSAVTVPANAFLEFLGDAKYRLGSSGSLVNNGVVTMTEVLESGTYRGRAQRSKNSINAILNGIETFTGSNPLDLFYGTFHVTSDYTNNAIVGSVSNTAPYGEMHYPVGVTGFGVNYSSGGQAWGLFGRADARAAGVVTTEINTFNFFGPPQNQYPPNRGIGITEALPIGMTVAAGGSYASTIGIHITPEGSIPSTFITGIYMNPDGCFSNGIFVDASTTKSPTVSGIFKNVFGTANSTCVWLQRTTSSPTAGAAYLRCVDEAGNQVMGISAAGLMSFASINVSGTVGASGVASALPANPGGYLKILIDGVVRQIPYYLP
jgi:hypothetical protein